MDDGAPIAAKTRPVTALGDVCVVTYVAFLLVGYACWTMMNVTYVELSYYMLVLPEGLSIFSYAMFALQSANIYPILYMWLNPGHRRMSVDTTIWACLGISLVGCVLAALFWDRTAVIGGQRHSVAVLAVTHIGGFVSATTSVVVYPFVAMFPPIYTSAVSTGMAFSGAIICLLGLWQKPYTENLVFSVETFYILCAATCVLSLGAFAFLKFHPRAQAERCKTISLTGTAAEESDASFYVAVSEVQEWSDKDMLMESKQTSSSTSRRILRMFWREMTWITVLSMIFYGILASISSFLFARYSGGDEERTAKFLTIVGVTVSCADPLARFITSFVRLNIVHSSSWTLVAISMFLFVSTLMEKPPASSDTASGYLLPLVLLSASVGGCGFTLTMIMLNIKHYADANEDAAFIESAYQWCGFLSQMGSFLGSAIIFPITVTHPEFFQAAVNAVPSGSGSG